MVRAETVVVGRGAKQARRHKLNKEEARAVEWGVQGAEEGPLVANQERGEVCVRGGSQGSVG